MLYEQRFVSADRNELRQEVPGSEGVKRITRPFGRLYVFLIIGVLCSLVRFSACGGDRVNNAGADVIIVQIQGAETERGTLVPPLGNGTVLT